MIDFDQAGALSYFTWSWQAGPLRNFNSYFGCQGYSSILNLEIEKHTKWSMYCEILFHQKAHWGNYKIHNSLGTVHLCHQGWMKALIVQPTLYKPIFFTHHKSKEKREWLFLEIEISRTICFYVTYMYMQGTEWQNNVYIYLYM